MQRPYPKPDNATLTTSDIYQSLQVFTTIKVRYKRGEIKANIVKIYNIHLN